VATVVPDWTEVFPTKEELRPSKHGKLLLLGDSFSGKMSPYFELHFEVVKTIYGGRSPGNLSFSQELLDAEKPDVVVIEVLERIWTAQVVKR